MEETYFLDKNETIEVWAKVVPFPWQDNRLVPSVSDPSLLQFNESCVEEVVSKGVVIRNMTVQISQVPRVSKASSFDNRRGNATFQITIFEETNDDPVRSETEIIVDCPPGRKMTVYRDVLNCPEFENYTFTIPSGQYCTDCISPISAATEPKTVKYDFSSLGCPLEANYYDVFKPTIQLKEDGKVLRNITASFVVFEMNGRLDYTYVATMAEVGCVREAQTYQKMIDNATHMSDASLAWSPENYKSCFVREYNEMGNLHQPYEILNESGLSALTWNSEGIYVFRAKVIDPEYSFCNLTSMFAVRVTGIESAQEELIPFLVLGTSVFGLFSIILIVFMTSK
ncbi:cation channel sperm-associated protein subunit epsilon-like [Dendronephthya gigantea]|uniref:cation channel sperm-associated protein subunit epsilon-like n=1 Tax=Dendronephthya gigantea TaxID=151771 RepID=UPI001069EE1F|nr:cation channel sperm-associated protein subunit epsilon-like [Dendronephthya gigantea]